MPDRQLAKNPIYLKTPLFLLPDPEGNSRECDHLALRFGGSGGGILADRAALHGTGRRGVTVQPCRGKCSRGQCPGGAV